jgi:translation initiation factor 1
MSNKNKRRDGVVYSTNPDFQNIEQENEHIESIKPSEQELRVWRDSKSRAGKTATIVKGFRGPESELSQLGKALKSKLGVGGTTKDGEIIIQGDFRERVTELLKDLGYKAKAAGG